MSSFKTFLTESLFSTNNIVRIRDTLARRSDIKFITFNGDNTVNVTSDILLNGTSGKGSILMVPDGNGTRLGVQLRSVTGNIDMVSATTLEGLPENRVNYLNINSGFLLNFKFIPPEIGTCMIFCPSAEFTGDETRVDILKLVTCNNNSLSGIYRVFKEIKTTCLINGNIDTGLLSILRVDGKFKIISTASYLTGHEKTDNVNDDRHFQAIGIISKHLHADRDILACQEELIQNGLKRHATL